jgi:hypothetical protein
MARIGWAFATAVGSLVALFACGNKTNTGAPAACIAGAIAAGDDGNAACTSCIETACGSALGDYPTSCADYIACICPEGGFVSSYEGACETEATETLCMSAMQTLQTCETAHCAKPCASSTDAGKDSSVDAGTVTVTFSCMEEADASVVCSLTTTSTSAATSGQSACTARGGTVGSSCPTAGLAGCCVLNTTIVDCYYDSDAGSSLAQACAGSYGVWSTTVP